MMRGMGVVHPRSQDPDLRRWSRRLEWRRRHHQSHLVSSWMTRRTICLLRYDCKCCTRVGRDKSGGGYSVLMLAEDVAVETDDSEPTLDISSA